MLSVNQSQHQARRLVAIITALFIGVTALTVGGAPTLAAAGESRIVLKVLLLSDNEPMSEAFANRMDAQGIPFQRIDLTADNRPTLTRSFLRKSQDGGDVAQFQAIIAPSAAPPTLSPEESRELASLQRDFGIRRFNAYVYPNADVQMKPPAYSGPADGRLANLTSYAAGNGFSYLKGTVRFEDRSADVVESYGYFAEPAGSDVTPVLTTPIPGSASRAPATLIGVYTNGGVEQMFSTVAQNSYQSSFQQLAPGVLSWVTRSVNLGVYRNYFSMHSDDVFLASAQWNSEQNCTAGYDCPASTPALTSRMTAEDVDYLRDWQRKYNVKIDQAVNFAGVAQAGGETDPLYQRFKASRSEFRFLSHTYSHLNLGCLKATEGPQWQCRKDASGNTVWRSAAEIDREITENRKMASASGFALNNRELVTGEHSGLKALPQVPQDNPNLVSTLANRGIAYLASDASRELEQRAVGQALTVPRYPNNVYFNTPTEAQAVDLYNWIYNSRADGGSGLCEDNPDTSTCVAPIDPQRGWQRVIVPQEAQAMAMRMMSNDPRPFYTHQANYTADRIGYDVLVRALDNYRGSYAANTPIINPTQSQAGLAMRRLERFAGSTDGVTATLQGTTVTIASKSGNRLDIPVTAPTGSSVTRAGISSDFRRYAGSQGGWITPTADGIVAVKLPANPGYGPAVSPENTSVARHNSSDTSDDPSTTVIEPRGPTTPDESEPATPAKTSAQRNEQAE